VKKHRVTVFLQDKGIWPVVSCYSGLLC